MITIRKKTIYDDGFIPKYQSNRIEIFTFFRTTPIRATSIITACAVLHNIAKDLKDEDVRPPAANDANNNDNGYETDEEDDDGGAQNGRPNGQAVRNAIVRFF